MLDAPDDTTLTVGTETPDPILPLRISFVEIVPRTTSTTEKVREPIGTGPYAIDDWEYGQKLHAAAQRHLLGPTSPRSPAPSTSGAARAASAPR